jgi:hypothetical protein
MRVKPEVGNDHEGTLKRLIQIGQNLQCGMRKSGSVAEHALDS